MSRRRSLYPATFVTARLTPNGGAARGLDVARGVLLRLAQNGGGRRSAAMARSPWCGVGFRQINHSRPSLGPPSIVGPGGIPASRVRPDPPSGSPPSTSNGLAAIAGPAAWRPC